MSDSEPQGRAEARHQVAALFEVLREGVALCEMIRNDQGEVIDYRIVEANPAFLRSLGGAPALGKTLLELRPDVPGRWFEMWQRVMAAAKPTRFEYEDRTARRWVTSM
jgi:PAS domain-containing protein